MTYYRVKEQYENMRRSDGSIYVGGELLTESETKKYNTPEHILDAVNVSRKKTYWFFGARFAA